MTTVALRWEEILMPLLQKYKLNITWGDQDLLNIIFHHNPGLCNHMHGIILDVNLMSCMTQTWDTKDVLDIYYQTNKYLRVNPVFYEPYQPVMSLSVLQKACMWSPASGTTVQTTAFMAATVNRLNKKVSSFSMETGEFTTMTSSQRFELSTKPSKR